ncbi:2-amino-4-hydroxy-6-hydroxymethyldihydropteridine diphosphokinase [Ureibacillus manganicus]|uniref:2-amino-4-hydroxy-6-hydroxymethyldihydropteridine diphosphokinase n=1 Tax=Ureibacillus manganicus DSM 26584 TaxID=1384049 RepID=A0A0A3HLQ4_9BACL|nr:2-amino-4-hydroxy-6-hydroxymethyldihydropteridine diphosphokinase [Ureibacillus manganicus]KGR73506.1 2-amino-4-hydroxy-6-hydroxymethyldihydropteridine pyrophosphokinase [Ureibacillus manganicus DSM 26584]
MNKVYLSIGTNIGDREQNLKHAANLLYDTSGIDIKAISSIYETAPVGYLDQPSFLNISLLLETTFSAMECLKICQMIENELGRVRDIRWGPRIIDLDILLFNNENIEVEHLIVPHPRMYERAFVLVPLLEIAEQPFSTHLEMAKENVTNMDLQKEGITKWKVTENVQEFLRL